MGSLGERKRIQLPHVVVFPCPGQGHMNPLMEFAKRRAYRNLHVTFIATERVRERMIQAQEGAAIHVTSALQNIRIETISDGLSPDCEETNDVDMRMDLMKKVGGLTFQRVIERLNSQGHTNKVSCIVYDSLLNWVPHIANKFNITSAFFWTQSCAVYAIYYHFYTGMVKAKDETENVRDVIEIPGLPQLCQSDTPSFLQSSNPCESLLRLVMDQFSTIFQATWILGNSFNELEMTEIQSINSLIPIVTVGPLVPSAFLDGNNPQDQDVGIHLWKTENCIDWLNTKEASTVAYVSFGSVAVLSKEQIIEIALGLKASRYSFLWVIRPDQNKEGKNNVHDFLNGFLEDTIDQGLVVSWCSQAAVLNHPSVGMFVTHCGWNSTLESLSSGLPVVTISQWSDQTTNSKYIEEVWKTGIRLNKTAYGLVGKDEIEKSVKTVMESEDGVELRKNALKWKTLAKEAMMKGGSSDKNIEWFIREVIGRTAAA
ncbi:hypothetical protein SUGI_0487220 [Cryptomeria japonica]|uniref:UDP-glycosyltransferase 74E1-like n=1 Tax=Cryptomeria japonica TaxID=3369 RepID=UPI002408C991|nr:UDP-glycosyltransferase 74E1-like [Cryptomeria japonica]GLJ25446.1 hypothetical protein SUGI_0487220 [Cryptomeria japonica]